MVPPDKTEKEIRLVNLRKANPDYDIMAIQDALIRHEWDMEKAQKHIIENCRPKIRYSVHQIKTSTDVPVAPVSTIQTPPNRTPVKSAADTSSPTQTPEIIKQMQIHQAQQPVPAQNGYGGNKTGYRRIKKVDSDRDSDQEDFDGKPSAAVFDSDESDDDAEYMNKERKEVFEFVNNAKVTDLINVKTLSQRKAEMLVEMRPFTSWADLLMKMKTHRYLSMDLLNNCQAFLDRRNNLTNIMKKCSRIVRKIGNAVENGGTVPKAPKLLSDE